jgi:hypothetical protein
MSFFDHVTCGPRWALAFYLALVQNKLLATGVVMKRRDVTEGGGSLSGFEPSTFQIGSCCRMQIWYREL